MNPDQLVDKSKGYGKLIQNVIIVIALIITVPMIFDWAYDLQSKILDTNVLYTVITGRRNESTIISPEMDSDERVEIIKKNSDNAAQMLTYQILSTFIYRDDDAEDEKDRSAIGDDGACYEHLGPNKDNYEAANLCLTDDDTINNTENAKYDGFTNEYKFLASTICIGFTAYVFLILAFDVAIRAVRLGVLQLIAPIPIISKLDPNSGKSGMFSKWLKDCCDTYLSLFIRLIGLFFAIEIIKSMSQSGRFVWYGTTKSVDFGFVKIFIILGLLMFVKQLPQFIKALTGFDMGGDSLNLKKKLGQIPMPGKKALGETAKTLSRKTMAGIDAKRNGQNFSDGWRRVEGTDPISKGRKNWDSYNPYSAQTRKNKREGAEEIKAIDTKWNKGKDAAETLGKGWNEILDGEDEHKDAYKKIFKNEQFVSSKMNLDREDEELKKLRQANAAKQAAGTLLEVDVKKLENQEKKVSGLQKVHDSMRKMYVEDAATEDAYKFYKYNATNPANLNQTREDRNVVTNSTMTNNSSTITNNSSTTIENVQNNSFSSINRNDNFVSSNINNTSVQSRVNETTGVSRANPSEHGTQTAGKGVTVEQTQQPIQQGFTKQNGAYSSNNNSNVTNTIKSNQTEKSSWSQDTSTWD